MPFVGSFGESTIVDEAYELNSPVVVKTGDAGEKSFMSISNRNIIADTVKLAEDGSGDVIIRLYESKGGYKNTVIKFNADIKEAYITDMLEKNPTKVDVKNNEISLNFKAFEVITLRIKNKN